MFLQHVAGMVMARKKKTSTLPLDALGYLSNMRLISIKNVDNSDEPECTCTHSTTPAISMLRFFFLYISNFLLFLFALFGSIHLGKRLSAAQSRSELMRINVNTHIDYAMDNKFWLCVMCFVGAVVSLHTPLFLLHF